MPEIRPYRLSIAPTLEAFRPEIEFAAGFVDRCYFVAQREHADTVLHYGSEPPTGAIGVPSALFPDGVRTDADGIHIKANLLAQLETGEAPVRLLPPEHAERNAGSGQLGYDALGLIFFMLSRIEERDNSATDRYGRFCYGETLAARRAAGAQPLADRAALDIAAAITGEAEPANRCSFAIQPTHDVDQLRGYHRLLQPLRYAAGDLIKRGQPAAAWRRLRGAYLSGEPWQSTRDLMTDSERRGLVSRFFFMGPSHLGMDSPYAATMGALLRRVADEIEDRGHVVGFHPGFATATDSDEWQRQKSGLEKVIGRTVCEGRHHVLQYRADTTPDIWEEAGMLRDYTLAFPETVGFRNGTCRPHKAYSLRNRRMLALEQVATPIMDFGLLDPKYNGLSVDAALDACRPAIDACQRYGGTLAILYHTGQSRGPAQEFYGRLLDSIQ